MQQPRSVQPGWRVLLIGGNAGGGKTVVARALASRFDRSHLLVDDIRMVIQQMTMPAEQPGIHYFLAHPTIWQKPPEALCDGLITVGNALIRPLSVIVAHHAHVESAGPIILEGDGLVPALAVQDSSAGTSAAANAVSSVFLIESDEEAILQRLRQRGRDFERFSRKEQEAQVRANWLYGQWLRRQADHYRLPVVDPRPKETLVERVLAVLGD
jgi:2-phosphoglycerate kinase